MIVLQRFLKYISITSPSNDGELINTQKEISEELYKELNELRIDTLMIKKIVMYMPA